MASEQGLEAADRVLAAARAGRVGPGDSVDVLLAAAETLRKGLSALETREEAFAFLKDGESYLPAGSSYSGVPRTIALVLDSVAEEISRDPRLVGLQPGEIAECVYNGLVNYAREALAKIYDYCIGGEGETVVVVPRGSLALACALAASQSGATVLLASSRDTIDEEEATPTPFDGLGERLPWFFAYQWITPGVRVVSQAELVTPTGAVASRGTRELLLEYFSAGAGKRFEILTLLASLSASGDIPEENKLPLTRVRTPWQAEAEIPALEIMTYTGPDGGLGRVASEIGWISLSRTQMIMTRRRTINMLKEVILRRCGRY